MTSPFDWLNAVNDNKRDLIAEGEPESSYNPFMVNRGLSYFVDTVMYASEMDRMSQLDKKLQFDFLRLSVRKRRRFSKWAKKQAGDDVQAVSDYYKYSIRRAAEVLPILTDEQLEAIREWAKQEK